MTDFLDDLIERSGILADVRTPQRHNTDDGEYTIDAFCTWEERIVRITYPSQNPQWMKRSDCGSHSQHRWSLYNSDLRECLQLVVMHRSCLNANSVQELGRNCEFRHIWRQPCKTPSNIFYILPLVSIEECAENLEPLVLSRCNMATETLHFYQKSIPKPVYNVKKVKSKPEKRKNIDRLEKDIEASVRQNNIRMKNEHWKTVQEHESFIVEQSIAEAKRKFEIEEKEMATPVANRSLHVEKSFSDAEAERTYIEALTHTPHTHSHIHTICDTSS